MDHKIKDEAVLETLIERFDKYRLPRLMDIRDKVNQGGVLSEYDIEFLEQAFKDSRQNKHYIEAADDEIKAIMMKILTIYKEITEKALQNEQKE